jgi:(4-(4-[2-(gamma-L-glutamylamino)ethyl]phenoxymethyl)furan-2-yl)methanamine synthase
MTQTIGWDLGGANLKRALIEGKCVNSVTQIPCPPLQEPCKFDETFAEALGGLSLRDARHAVTMTGELSDVFADRTEGVGYLSQMVARALPDVAIYAGRAGFVTPRDAAQHAADIASANWHASAGLVAQRYGDGLFVDIGTTTTDIIPIRRGAVASAGYTDAERLAAGELVYTGVVRTPVMAIAQSVPFKGRVQRVCAERFATMADVYRLTGELPDDADPYPSADQRGKSREESAARLARMLGMDAPDATTADWVALAQDLAQRQLDLIADAARKVIADAGAAADAPIIGAGCGRFLARDLAERLAVRYLDFAELIPVEPSAREMAARCAPAVAVALLLERLG